MRWRLTAKRKWITAVFSLRNIPLLHKPAKWLKDYAWTAIVEAGLELCRKLFEQSKSLGPPTRAASIYQMLRTGDPPLQGRIVVQDQGTPQLGADSLTVGGHLPHHKHQPWPIFWSRHDNAQLVGESLALLLERKTICLEAAYHYSLLRGDPAFRFLRLPAPLRLSGNWTSVVSRWAPCGKPNRVFNVNHTHWLLDALPRLAMLEEFPADTGILVPANLHPQHRESLALLGLESRCRPTVEHHLRIANYYFSSPTAVLNAHNPYAVRFLRSALLPKRDQSFASPKRFLIQRPKDIRTAKNEEEFERLFAKRGWAIVDVSTLTFAQQIQLFHHAEAIVGMSGSALTNAVFCSDNCRVGAFMFDWALDGWVEWIAQVVGFRWHYRIVRTNYTRTYQIESSAVNDLLDNLAAA